MGTSRVEQTDLTGAHDSRKRGNPRFEREKGGKGEGESKARPCSHRPLVAPSSVRAAWRADLPIRRRTDASARQALAFEKNLDGVFALKTSNRTLTTEEIVITYRDELSNVDRAFRNLKGQILLRPIYHWLDRGVKAHVFLRVLSFLLECMLQKRLSMAGIEMTAPIALDEMASMLQVKDVLDDIVVYRVTEPAAEQKKILECLGIKPPRPRVEQNGAVASGPKQAALFQDAIS